MAVSFVAVASDTGTLATATGTIPTGTATDNIMIAFVMNAGSGTTVVTPPTGWTLQEADPNPADFSLWCYTKKYAADAAPVWVFSTTGGWSIDIVTYAGNDTTTPINLDVAYQAAATNDTVLTLDPTVDNCLLVAFGGVDATGTARTWTETGSMTERVERADNNMHRVVAEEQISGQASTTRTLTVSGSAQDVGGFMLAITPAATVTNTTRFFSFF